MATTTVRGEQRTTSDLVGRDFTAAAPGCKLVGEITYIRTCAGWLYLATVIDCFNREVIGYAITGHMRTSLVGDALEMAARNHRWPSTAFSILTTALNTPQPNSARNSPR